MMAKIIGSALPNMPWQDKPANCKDVLWRYDQNPIIERDEQKNSNSIFNSAVVPWEDGFIGVFRCDS
ncbi:MAG: glycosidase, partial [Oscillospiraceae bacterium]